MSYHNTKPHSVLLQLLSTLVTLLYNLFLTWSWTTITSKETYIEKWRSTTRSSVWYWHLFQEEHYSSNHWSTFYALQLSIPLIYLLQLQILNKTLRMKWRKLRFIPQRITTFAKPPNLCDLPFWKFLTIKWIKTMCCNLNSVILAKGLNCNK